MKKVLCMIFSVSLALMIVLSVSLSAVGALTFPNDVKTMSEAILLVSMDNKQVVYEKNADKQMYPASTTKIMTYIVAYENIEDIEHTSVVIKQSIIDELRNTGSSMAFLSDHIGEKVSVTDLFYSLMVPSGNDAAMVLADYVGNGDIQAFVDKMNAKAEELGCENTHFANPDGLHDPDHYTTARDLQKITEYALTLPDFELIANTVSYTCKGDDTPLVTTNKLIDPSTEYYYMYAKGIKTGTTDEAGRCLVTTASEGGQTYMLILLGAPYKEGEQEEYYTFTDAADLFRWCLVQLKLQPVKTAETPICEVKLNNAMNKKTITLVPEKDINAILPVDLGPENIVVKENVPKELSAPLKTNQVVGTADVYYVDSKTGEEQFIESVNLCPAESVDRSGAVATFSAMGVIFKSYWFLIVIGVILVVVLIYIIAAKIHRYRKKKNRDVKRYRNF